MKSKSSLLHIPVIISAAWAVFRQSGLPGSLHLTPARLLFMLMTLGLSACWFLLYYRAEIVTTRKSVRSYCFQSALLTGLFSIILLIAGKKLAGTEGFRFVAGSFIRQASPFLIFLIVLNLCTGMLLYLTLRGIENHPLKLLFTESMTIPQIMLIFAACMLLYGAFFPLRENYYPSHDYSIFAYIGQQILRGKIPYTQLWDHKPPVIFYLNALGLKLFRGSLAGIWVPEFIGFFIGALILFRILKRRFPAWISLAVLIPGLLHYVRVLDFGNYTEEASLFFALCAMGLVFQNEIGRNRHILLKGLASGLLAGLAFTCKQNTIGTWVALLIADLFTVLPAKKSPETFRERLNFWLAVLAGFILVNALWVAYFALNHALEAYWDVAFRFNLIYSEKSGESRFATAWTTFTFIPAVSPWLFLAFISWIPAFAACCRAGFGEFARKHPLALWALADLPIELVFAGLSGMNYQHYFILCIPPVIVLLCFVMNLLSARFSSHNQIFRGTAVLLFIAASLPLIPLYRDNYIPRSPSAYTKARDYLLSETDPDRPILVWGSRSAIYVMSGRYAPTAYFNERPLYLFPGEIRGAQWNELLNDIQNDPPQVVIYTHDTALPFIEESTSGCVIPQGADYTVPVYNYFCENYRYETTINSGFRDAWEVYRKR